MNGAPLKSWEDACRERKEAIASDTFSSRPVKTKIIDFIFRLNKHSLPRVQRVLNLSVVFIYIFEQIATTSSNSSADASKISFCTFSFSTRLETNKYISIYTFTSTYLLSTNRIEKTCTSWLRIYMFTAGAGAEL